MTEIELTAISKTLRSIVPRGNMRSNSVLLTSLFKIAHPIFGFIPSVCLRSSAAD
jgi:hypothetical protein